MKIVPYNDLLHRNQVVTLWGNSLNYNQPRNNPSIAIDRKLTSKDGLFFVTENNGVVIGTVMAGYDGHRGWIYSLAVQEGFRNQGVGSKLLQYAINSLKTAGCPKINLQVVEGNETVISFYQKNGFRIEPRISMGLEIHENTKLS